MPLFQPTAIFRGVEHITPEYLKENGITALILDVDNTLTGHGSQVLPEKVAEWIKTMKQAGIAYATEQIIDLIANGVKGIHLYTMNRPEVAAAIFHNLSYILGRDDV